MGRAQRQIEAAGITTVCLSNIAEFTLRVGAPRVVGLQHPGSQPLGPAGDAEHQREVLRQTLRALETIEAPNGLVELDVPWPKKVRPAAVPKELPPIAKLLIRKPWLLPRFVSGRIPT